jgi:hypothetical protein
VRRIRVSAHFVGANPGRCETVVEANTFVFEHIWPGAGTVIAYGLKRDKIYIFFKINFNKIRTFKQNQLFPNPT